MRIKYLLLLTIFLLTTITVSATNPVITIVSPTNNATNIVLENNQVKLKANVVDADGDLAYIEFQTNKTGSWQSIATVFTSGENWSSDIPVTFSGLEHGVKYWWRINAKDADNNWTNLTASFTTANLATSIQIIPMQPRAGKKVLFILDDVTTTGYVLCHETNNVYLLNIINGIGMIELDVEEYGEAVVTIPNAASKVFNIASPFEGDLVIDVPAIAEIDEEVEISVYAMGERVSTSLKLISPTGIETQKTTSDTKAVEMKFTETGNWTLMAEMYNAETMTNIYINPKPLNIEIDEYDLRINKEMLIDLNTEGTVKIQKDAMSWTYNTDTQGRIYFQPPVSGRYTITATADGQSGTKYFTVKEESYIWIKNDEGFQVNTIKEGDILFIQATDYKGNLISGNDLSVTIQGDAAVNTKSLSIVGGSAIWKVDEPGNQYMFDFYPDSNMYLPSFTTISGEQIVNLLYLYIILIIAILFLLFYYLRYKNIFDIMTLIPSRRKKEWEDDLL